jgi:Tfp pilus assembly protein PilW
MVELLVGLAVFAVAIGAIYFVLTNEVAASSVTGHFIETQQGARLAMELMVEEARWADGIVSASTSPTAVTVHIPAPNPLLGNQEYQATYTLLGDGTLQRTVVPAGGAAVASTMASHVTGLTMTFYDNANPPNPLPAALAPSAYQMGLSITVTVGQQFRTFASTVSLRNKP